MKRKIGLILAGGILTAGLLGGCQGDNSTPSSNNGAGPAYPAGQTQEQSNGSQIHPPIPTRAASHNQNKAAPARQPALLPVAPPIDHPANALLHDDFSDTTLHSYQQTSVSGANPGPFHWAAQGNRLLLKGDVAETNDDSQQEIMLTRQKGFSNYSVSVNIYLGHTSGSGLVFSATDEGHYYLFSFGRLSDGTTRGAIWHLNGRDKPAQLLVKSNAFAFAPDTWQQISVTVVNGDITARVNGITVAVTHDAGAGSTQGGVGLYASASNDLAFANLNVVPAQAAH